MIKFRVEINDIEIKKNKKTGEQINRTISVKELIRSINP